MKKPTIGILASISDMVMKNDDSSEMISLGLDYANSVEMAGGTPIVVPPLEDSSMIDFQLDLCDGVLLTGGIDINPMTYGEDPHKLLRKYSTKLDMFQLEFIRKVLERDMPMLGICRGHQLLNIAFGGTLYQDPSAVEGKVIIQHVQMGKHCEAAHRIHTSEKSVVRSILGETHYVNSYHHQFIKKLGKGLVATAWSQDGVIEAIEHKVTKSFMGVQWHPERMSFCDEKMRRIFDWLIDKAKRSKDYKILGEEHICKD